MMRGKQVPHDDEDDGWTRHRASQRSNPSSSSSSSSQMVTPHRLNHDYNFLRSTPENAAAAAVAADARSIMEEVSVAPSATSSTSVSVRTSATTSRTGTTNTKAQHSTVSPNRNKKRGVVATQYDNGGMDAADVNLRMAKEAAKTTLYVNECVYEEGHHDPQFPHHHEHHHQQRQQQDHLDTQTNGGSITDEEGSFAPSTTTNSANVSTSTTSDIGTTVSSASNAKGNKVRPKTTMMMTTTHYENKGNNTIENVDMVIRKKKKKVVKNVLQINDFVYEEQGQPESVARHHYNNNVPGAVQMYDIGDGKTLALAPAQHHEHEWDNQTKHSQMEDIHTAILQRDDCLPKPGAVHVAGFLEGMSPSPPATPPDQNSNEANVVAINETLVGGGTDGYTATLEAELAPHDDEVVNRVVERFQGMINDLIPQTTVNPPIEAKPVTEEELQRMYNNNNNTNPIHWKRRVCIGSFVFLVLAIIGVVVGLFVGGSKKKEPSYGYCNWNNCNGEPQGGDWCNMNQHNCEVGCSSDGETVKWCDGSTTGTTTNNPDGYCNWDGCNGEVQGGDWCNQNKYMCEVDCYSLGVKWCEHNNTNSTDQNTTTTSEGAAAQFVPATTAYCNWNNCNGEAQGGDWCNQSKENCEEGCYSEGVKWCEPTTSATPPASSPATTSGSSSASSPAITPASSGQYCGEGNVGNGVCQDGSCCSDEGWCGISELHCRGYITCGNGTVGNGVCVDGSCCSEYGYCGTTAEYCGETSYCGDGYIRNGICEDGTCCSKWGYCGTTAEHCELYCGNGSVGNGICIEPGTCCSQSGNCEACGGEAAPSCGDGTVGNGICADGMCCSQFGYCGTTAEYCGSSSSSSTRLNGNRSLLRQHLGTGA